MPCVLIGKGHVLRPAEGGPVIARPAGGPPPDVLDVTERLGKEFGRLFVVDLDGVDRNRPQLDYLQEIARDAQVWVDGGVRSPEEAIDILVTGAYRAVLSSARLPDARALRRAWRMSTELAFELEIRSGKVAGTPGWHGRSVAEVAAEVREVGLTDLVLSFREEPVDWQVVATIAAEGPTWVDGTFERSDASRLATAGAAGGIFHLGEWLDQLGVEGPSSNDRRGRDDESRTS